MAGLLKPEIDLSPAALKRDANRRAKIVTRQYHEWQVILHLEPESIRSELMTKERALKFKKQHPELAWMGNVTVELNLPMAKNYTIAEKRL